jgi:hypothetical protein
LLQACDAAGRFSPRLLEVSKAEEGEPVPGPERPPLLKRESLLGYLQCQSASYLAFTNHENPGLLTVILYDGPLNVSQAVSQCATSMTILRASESLDGVLCSTQCNHESMVVHINKARVRRRPYFAWGLVAVLPSSRSAIAAVAISRRLG